MPELLGPEYLALDRQHDLLKRRNIPGKLSRDPRVAVGIGLAAIDPFQIVLHESLKGADSLSARHSKKSNSAWNAIFSIIAASWNQDGSISIASKLPSVAAYVSRSVDADARSTPRRPRQANPCVGIAR